LRIVDRKSLGIGAGGIFALAVLLSATASPPKPQSTATAAKEVVLTVDPTQSKVHYMLDSTVHTVHGTFAVKQGTMHFDPASGKASGEVVVYATSGESGNSSRDAKMHKDVLESKKYPDVVFKPTEVEGKVVRSGSSDVKVHGIFSLHGSDHELIVPVHAELAGDRWKGSAQFDVPFIDWGLKDPSNFLLHVKHVVGVELELTGSVNSSN